MSLDTAFQGSLFANDFLCDSVTETADWQAFEVDEIPEDLALRTFQDSDLKKILWLSQPHTLGLQARPSGIRRVSSHRRIPRCNRELRK